MRDEPWREAGFGLYIHWPFCQAKCPYCDFNSHVSAEIDQARWLAAYISEIKRVSSETRDRILTSVFFGGGTPSLMSPEMVAAILDEVRRGWRAKNDLEITLEANPTSIEMARFQGFRDAGVNRVSVGIQALNDDDLRRLGRMHNVAEARSAFDVAQRCFDRVSFDLIYARQHQSVDDWQNELKTALGMAADHLSLYQLTIEPGTVFAERYDRGLLRGLPGEDPAADMYDVTQNLCEAAGLPAYEVSNHAKPDAASRHNLIYWRGGDYAGIGPGAHGRLTKGGRRFATETALMPQAWLERVEQAGSGETIGSELSRVEWSEEYLMMAMRLREGADLARYESIRQAPLNQERLDALQEMGLVSLQNGRLSATTTGRPILNAILAELLAGSESLPAQDADQIV